MILVHDVDSVFLRIPSSETSGDLWSWICRLSYLIDSALDPKTVGDAIFLTRSHFNSAWNDSVLYLHAVRWPLFADFETPEKYGMARLLFRMSTRVSFIDIFLSGKDYPLAYTYTKRRR